MEALSEGVVPFNKTALPWSEGRVFLRTYLRYHYLMVMREILIEKEIVRWEKR